MQAQLVYKALTDPDALQVKTRTETKADLYRLAWAFYENRMFSPDMNWEWYLSPRGFYKETRLVFNPFVRVVDFYLDNIWQTAHDLGNPKLITPVAEGTDENLVDAIAQMDEWTNWWEAQQEVKTYTAVTGNVLVEIIDEPATGRISENLQWAVYVTDLQLNNSGDVLAYTIEKNLYDDKSEQTYRYKKIVTKESFSYFKDDKPFSYTDKAADDVIPNPYGFCPAVWFKHGGGGAVGTPAFNSFDKMNRANGLLSHCYDNIDKEIESGKILGMDDPSSLQVISGGKVDRNGIVQENDPRLDRVLIAAKGNVAVSDLAGKLKLNEAYPWVRDFLTSFGDDYPELEYRQVIKENASLSGIALERLLTPAQNRLDRAAPRYNGQLIKLRQMEIAIAGWRTSNGWTNLSDKQRLFAPFNLDSYRAGSLDFNLKRSLLIEQTELEREELEMQKANRAIAADGILPLTEKLKILGKNDEEAVRIKAEMENETASIGTALGRAFDAGNGVDIEEQE